MSRVSRHTRAGMSKGSSRACASRPAAPASARHHTLKLWCASTGLSRSNSHSCMRGGVRSTGCVLTRGWPWHPRCRALGVELPSTYSAVYVLGTSPLFNTRMPGSPAPLRRTAARRLLSASTCRRANWRCCRLQDFHHTFSSSAVHRPAQC